MSYRLSLLLLALGGLMVQPLSAGQADGRLDIYWVDVEGGGATLIVTPQNESILIDTGNPGVRDPGRIAQAATRVAGLKKIDHIIVTHYHLDHYGGAEALSKMLPIGALYDNGKFAGMPDNPGKAYFELECEKRVVIHPGSIVPLKSSDDTKTAVRLQCLATRKTFIKPEAVNAQRNDDAEKLHRPKERDGSDNANSVVMLLQFGQFRFLDAGDLTWNQEKRLVHPFNLAGQVDVYQVTHHGLDSSNNPILLQSVKPRVAIMNNGVTKGCAPEVFANLNAVPSIQAIYQLHKNLRPDGKTNNTRNEFIANSERECNGHYIKLSVSPDGSSYTVSIPAHGHQRTYQTRGN